NGTRARTVDDLRTERVSKRAHPVSHTTVHYTAPMTFNEVEEVGDRFRNDIPVIMNLAGASESVAKRVLDFASGLIYGLDGRIERVGDRVFLLTPRGVEFSTEERRKLSERGFFNQA
ncbi:MAG: cell division protein SepF, partial [Actinobacteria bacterium]|nr:cell division protein SepF [Actinomycetota bacterium]